MKYRRTLNFPSAGFSFKGFVERFIPHGDSEVARALSKAAYTSFSGKFAQGNVRTMLLKNDPDKLKPEDYRTGIPFGDWILVTRRTPYSRFSNFVWTAFINAYGRRNLQLLFDKIRILGGRPLYCNTDGTACFLPSAMAARQVVDSFPHLPLKCKALESARVLSPKSYMYRDKEGVVEVAAAGIPTRLHGAIAAGQDDVFAEVPDTLAQALRRGALAGELKNTWVRRRFSFSQVKRLGRRLLPDGWTVPYRFPLEEAV